MEVVYESANADYYRHVYADSFGVKISRDDLLLNFGIQQTVNSEAGRAVITVNHFSASMSVSLAKSLAVNLTNLIRVVESVNGTISVSESSLLSKEYLREVASGLRNIKILEESIDSPSFYRN